jgi:hypothetical protein
MKIKELYLKLCELENLKPIPIKFGRVGKAGACLTYTTHPMKSLYITFDLSKMMDIEYALYHEFTHQYCIEHYNDAGHGAKFKKEFNRINDKYMYSKIVAPYIRESKITNTPNIVKEKIEASDILYHGTSKGATVSIQRNGYLMPHAVGEDKPSISFTGKLDYAKYYAKAKGGTNGVILRTMNDSNFKLTDRIKNNKNDEFITFEKIPISKLEILTPTNTWVPLHKWDLIDNKLQELRTNIKIEIKKLLFEQFDNTANFYVKKYNEWNTQNYLHASPSKTLVHEFFHINYENDESITEDLKLHVLDKLIENYEINDEFENALLELTYKDLRSDAKDGFLNIRDKSNKTPFGTKYRGITKDGLIHFISISFTDHDHYYDQYVQIIDFKKILDEFKGKLQPIEIVRKMLVSDIKLHCTDPSWKYWGFQYKGTINNYAINPENRFPKVRNKNLDGAVCKHLDSVLYVLPFKATQITVDLKKLGVFK